jgi:protein-histidine pros-kinase
VNQIFRRLLEAAPDAMVVLNQQGEIVLVNSRVEQMFRYQREELAGQEIEILVPERFRARHPESRKQFCRGDPNIGGSAVAGL